MQWEKAGTNSQQMAEADFEKQMANIGRSRWFSDLLTDASFQMADRLVLEDMVVKGEYSGSGRKRHFDSLMAKKSMSELDALLTANSNPEKPFTIRVSMFGEQWEVSRSYFEIYQLRDDIDNYLPKPRPELPSPGLGSRLSIGVSAEKKSEQERAARAYLAACLNFEARARETTSAGLNTSYKISKELKKRIQNIPQPKGQLQGWLSKPDFKQDDVNRTGRRKQIGQIFGSGQFQMRWWKLQGKMLMYFKDNSPQTAPKGSIDLSTVTHIRLSERAGHPPHALDLVTNDRTYTVAAMDEPEMLRWARVLNTAIKEVGAVARDSGLLVQSNMQLEGRLMACTGSWVHMRR